MYIKQKKNFDDMQLNVLLKCCHPGNISLLFTYPNKLLLIIVRIFYRLRNSCTREEK